MPAARVRRSCHGTAADRLPRALRLGRRQRHPASRSTNRWPVPEALGEARLACIRDAHAAAAIRAERLGFDLVELLGAHGFLLHSFLSPISNRRTDSYGGSLGNRMRYPLEVAAAIREVWPRHKALGMRITGADWVDGGIRPDEAGIFAGKLRNIGFNYVCVSSGGISPAARPAIGPGYQVPLAAAVKKASGMVVQAVGMIVNPHRAEAIVADGHADCVAVARGFLDDPHWAWHAAAALGADAVYPPLYRRARPEQWPGQRGHRTDRRRDAARFRPDAARRRSAASCRSL
jgi:2,4-dienoyl-CoA reductase-like NADH-dependent reductase (Old Yellow Enzyme family)